MAATVKMQALQDTSISSSIKWYSGKDGTKHKNCPKGMFVTKRENRNFSIKAVPKLENPTTCWKISDLVSTDRKANQSSLNDIMFYKQKCIRYEKNKE